MRTRNDMKTITTLKNNTQGARRTSSVPPLGARIPNIESEVRTVMGGVFKGNGLRMALMAVLALAIVFAAIGAAEAVTYNMQGSTATIGGITANYGSCGSQVTTSIIAAMDTTTGSVCGGSTGGRIEITASSPADMVLLISDTPYAADTLVGGTDVTASLRNRGGGGEVITYTLGYVTGGTFTAFPSGVTAVESRTIGNVQGDYTTNFNANTGIAPAGTYLALQVQETDTAANRMRIYFTATSIVLNVTESAACSGTAPSNLSANSPNPNQVDLTWTYDGSNNDYYNVYRDTVPSTGVVQIATNVTTGSYSDNTVSSSTQYDYWVRGYNNTDTCESGDSNTANVTTASCSASAPGDLADTLVLKDQVDLQWTGASCGSNNTYTVYRDGVAVSVCQDIPCSAGTMTCSDTTAPADTNMDYTVRGYNTANTCESGDSNVVNVTTPADPYQLSGGTCGGCHTYPPTDGTRDGSTGAFVGDHQKHNFPCSTCHIAPATESTADYSHRDGNITMATSGIGATGISGGYYDKNNSASYTVGADDEWAQTNIVTTQSCRNISCHGTNNPTPQWGVGGPVACTDCHNGTLTRTMAAGTLDNVVSEFGLAWGHKKSGRGAVTSADCIVCHLEGNYSTQGPSAYHADGNIDLRDPDGAGETPITDYTGGAFTFQKFSISYNAGDRASAISTNPSDPQYIADTLTQKFCLACHDSDGATNTTARTSGGTAAMPWGGVALGANYSAANDAIGTQGLIDVKSQFDPAYFSRHPVRAPRSKDYPTADRVADPYKPTGTRGTQGTQSDSVIMNCFDCHADSTPSTTRTIVSHGSANTIRGTIYVANPSLCLTCHLGAYSTSNNHGTGSAWGATGSSHNTVRQNCHWCHGDGTNGYPSRPVAAQQYHGFNSTWASTGNSQYAFIRAWANQAYHQPYRSSEFTSGSATCANGNTGSSCPNGQRVANGTSPRTYTPGGTY